MSERVEELPAEERFTQEEEALFIASTLVKKRRPGRPNTPDADKILSNGFSARQWVWIQREAKLRHMDAAQLQRMIADWFIDSIEASRSGPIATPKDDAKFEKLVKATTKRKTKSKRK